MKFRFFYTLILFPTSFCFILAQLSLSLSLSLSLPLFISLPFSLCVFVPLIPLSDSSWHFNNAPILYLKSNQRPNPVKKKKKEKKSYDSLSLILQRNYFPLGEFSQ